MGRPTLEFPANWQRDNATLAHLINALHGAVSSAIAGHHFGTLPLPTKEGRLDWSMGPEVRVIRERSGA